MDRVTFDASCGSLNPLKPSCCCNPFNLSHLISTQCVVARTTEGPVILTRTGVAFSSRSINAINGPMNEHSVAIRFKDTWEDSHLSSIQWHIKGTLGQSAEGWVRGEKSEVKGKGRDRLASLCCPSLAWVVTVLVWSGWRHVGASIRMLEDSLLRCSERDPQIDVCLLTGNTIKCLSFCSLHILQKGKQIQVTARDTSSSSFLCNVADEVWSTIHSADYHVFEKLNDPFHLIHSFMLTLNLFFIDAFRNPP